TTDSNEPPVDQNNRKVKNAKCLKFLVSQIPSCLTPLFQGLAKMLFSRKSPDASQKKQAFKISDAIAEVLRDHLTWPRYGLDSETDSTNKYNYLTIMLGLLSLLFLDERSQVSLQTMLVVSFDRVKGLEEVFTLLRQFWSEAEEIKAFEEYSTIEVDEKSKEKLSRIHGCIDVTLNFFQFVGSSKLLHESAQTVPLTTKDRDPRNEPFDPFNFLVNVRAKILPVINELWQSTYLPKAPPNIVRSVLQNLVQILKGDGEVNQRPEGSGSSSGLSAPTSTLFGATRSLVPDEDRVQQLIDMGFPRSSAETALIRCNNHVQAATDYLLTHPQTIAATVFSSAPSTDTGRNLSDTTSTRGNAPTDAGSTIDVTVQALALSMQGNQTPVEGATTSEGSIPMETETTSTKPDKGKGKEVDYIDKFKTQRDELRSTSASRALELLDAVEDIIFEVKDLFVLLSKDNAEQNIELIIKSIEAVSGHPEEQRKKALNSRLRLLALLLNENSIQGKIPNLPFNIFSDMTSMVSEQAGLPLESPLPKWIAPALLVIEAFISLSEEPVGTELGTKPDESKDINASLNGLNFIKTESRTQLLEYCLSLLKRKDLDKDIINALLRIVVRLTRRYSDAIEFVNKDGLNLLFNAFKSRAHDFRGQQIFIVMILRHALEDDSVLESIIDKEIKNWFANPRPRGSDISAYLRNNAQFALRAPEIFVKSTKKLCKLARYDSSGRSQQITLIKPETEDTSTSTTKDSITNEEEMTDALPVPSTSVSLGSPKKFSFGSETAENIVQFIANELVATRLQNNQTLDTKVPETNSNDRNENVNSAATTSTSTNSTSTPQSAFKPEEHLDYLYRCFLLQCLTELLSSYPSCKIEVVNLSRRRNSMGSGTQSKSKTSLLYYLLNELLPYGCITPSTNIEMRKRYGQSKWTTSALVALCSNISSEVDDKKPQPEIIQVRKFVLECIIKSFRTAISSSDPIETKYGRLLALAELCYAILNSRTGPNTTANKPIEDGPASIAKLMLDKNFVNTLTDALAEVDLNYPSARILINALLKPFECLTKVAIKLGRSPEAPNKEQQRHDSISSISTPSADEMNPETEDAPDLYATSVLGALEGRLDSDEMDDDSLDSSVDEQRYDDGEFDEGTGSDLSDVSNDDDLDEGDDDNGDDMDVEIVVRQPIHGHSVVLDNEGNDDHDSEIEHGVNQHLENEDDSDDEGHHVRGNDDQEMWDVHDQVMIERGDIVEEIIDAEGQLHRHHVIDDGYDRLNFNWAWNQPGTHFMNDDEFGIPNRTGRALFSFGNRRHRHIPGRRTILEVPPEGLDYVIGDPVGYGFNFGTNDDVDNSGLWRNNRTLPDANDDITTHPLLVNRSPTVPSVASVELTRGRSARNGPLGDWTQSIEELIGGGAVQLLEQLLTRSRGLGHSSTYRLELNTGSSGLVSGIEVDRVFPRTISSGQENQNMTPPSDPITAVQEFKPHSTGQRWYDEARMMYGSSVGEKATKLVNHVYNALVPYALEEEKKRKEREEREREERRQREEEERIKAEEEAERRRKEQEELRLQTVAEQSMSDTITNNDEIVEVTEVTEVIELIDPMQEDAPIVEQEQERAGESVEMEDEPAPVTTDLNMEEGPSLVPDNSQPQGAAGDTVEGSSEGQSTRTTVMVNGRPVDITDTGIDPTFLEALPDELREEVLNQHLPPERRNRPPVTSGAGDAISTEFLAALPDDLREEIIQQEEALEQERIIRHRTSEPAAAEMDTASFFASLDPQLRQTVLLEQDEMVLASLPPAIVAEANALRERASRRYTNAVRSRTLTAPQIQAPKKPSIHRDAVKLVDTPGLATL
ncbi:10676_t:CDS:2, partial [Dentiscutata heterogama]